MTLLKRRVEKLEASKPAKKNSLSHLTLEELDERLFNSCKVLHEACAEIDGRALLWNPKCRQFAKDESWVRDANHRISVFQEFLGIAYKKNLPDEIKAMFGLGWRNVPIPEKDIDLTLEVLRDANLGEETPWLKEYLENSGVVSEYHQYQYRSIEDN